MLLHEDKAIFTVIASILFFVASGMSVFFVLCLFRSAHAVSPEEEDQDDLQTVKTESTFCNVKKESLDFQAGLEEVGDDSERIVVLPC